MPMPIFVCGGSHKCPTWHCQLRFEQDLPDAEDFEPYRYKLIIDETGDRCTFVCQLVCVCVISVCTKSQCMIAERSRKHMNYLPLGSTTFTEMPESQDGTAIRALQSIGLLKDARVLEVSDMVGDQSQFHRSQVVNEIRRNAEKPGVCVIVDFDEILDGFYDLLNLRFQRIQLED